MGTWMFCRRCGTEVETEIDEELREESPYYCPNYDENMYSFECINGMTEDIVRKA